MVTHTKTDAQKGDDVVVKADVKYKGALFTTPVVIEPVKGKRRKKRRYTKGTKGVQRLTLGISDALYRTANSVAKAERTFTKRSKRSARKKKDGLVRDYLRNASRGISKGFNELGEAPNEIARRIGTGQVRRTFRFFVPFVSFGR